MVPARRGLTARAFFMFCPSNKPFIPCMILFSSYGGMCIFREHFTCKPVNAGFGITPRLAAQPGLPAGFLKELFTRETMFDGHLRQE